MHTKAELYMRSNHLAVPENSGSPSYAKGENSEKSSLANAG